MVRPVWSRLLRLSCWRLSSCCRQAQCYRGSNAPYDANRLYVKAFLWTEADDNIDLNNIKVAVSETAVPEPSKPSYAWKQRVEGHHLC
jgi:hypothetical protein